MGGIITDALKTAEKEMGKAFTVAGQEIERALGNVATDLSNLSGPFCPQCGKKNPLGAGFCFSCGRKILSAA